jgi:glycosyltransferase involved in cell wall biosynthesis
MKVLIATDNYYPNVNGASYAAQRLATALMGAGQQVLVVAPGRRMGFERFSHEGIDIWGVPSLPFERIRIPIPIVGTASTVAAIKEWKPDVIHIESHFGVGRTAAGFARRMGIPLVGTNHFMPENLVHFVPITEPGRRLLAYLMWKWFLITFRRVAVVTTPTHTAASLLSKVGLTKNIEVISNGIDLARFNPHAGETEFALPDEPRLLYVGRLDREKNVDMVIRAFAAARKQAPFHLVIVGTGAESRNLAALAEQLDVKDHVTFTGFVPDETIPKLYASCDAFVMAGTAELQSIVTMEAMASGLPIIAVSAVALPELVDSTNGFTFTHGDIPAMTRAMEQLFTNQPLRKKLGQGSLARIKNHDANGVTKQYLAVYERARA